jgi:hypothetical protein
VVCIGRQARLAPARSIDGYREMRLGIILGHPRHGPLILILSSFSLHSVSLYLTPPVTIQLDQRQ